MKLQYVKLKNFKSYPDQETTIDLSFDGIKLLVGENGDGKSTFFDAIIWGIYGKNKDGVDGVVNRKTKKDCKVEVGFKVGSSNYSIIRYRKHETNGNKLLFFKETKNISQRTSGATQELIDGIIEIQYNTMISSVILSSELYTSFLRSSRADRLRTFESILSLKEITLFYNKLKKLKEPIDEKVSKLNSDVDKTFVAIKSLTDNIDEYKEGVKKTLLTFKSEKEILQDKVFQLTNKISEYTIIDVDKEIDNNEAYDIIVNRIKEIDELISTEQNKLVDINNLVAQLEGCKEQINNYQRVDIQKELIQNKEYLEIKTKNEKIKTAIIKLKSGIKDTNEITKSINKFSDRQKILIIEVENIQEHLDTCPTCGQEVEVELTQNLITKKQSEIDKIEKSVEKEKELAQSYVDKNKEIEEAIKKLKSLVADTTEPAHSSETLHAMGGKLKDEENRSLLLEKDIENTENNNKEIETKLSAYRIEKKTNVDNKLEPEYHTMFLKDLKEKIVLMKDEAEEKRLEIEIIDVKAKSSYDKGYIDNTLETIKNQKSKLNKLDKKLTIEETEKKHYEALLTVFSNKDSGFKKFFINKMVSIFNDRVNFYLPFFFDDDVEVEFDKDLNEIIKVNKEEVTFASFSSGQKTRFDIAISFSLFFMVKMFFSSTINLLVFDEILDMNLDKKGFNSVYDIIENLGEFNTVFVVSHQEFYKDKFNHHIHIKRNSEGFSYIHNEV